MAAKLLPQRSTTEGFDDDGRTNRTGTVRTASAHIITAVIGSGVLTLPWAMAQLGWLAGITALLMFCIITWFCTTLQADCYRYPDPVTGARNYTYMDAVRSNLDSKLSGFLLFDPHLTDPSIYHRPPLIPSVGMPPRRRLQAAPSCSSSVPLRLPQPSPAEPLLTSGRSVLHCPLGGFDGCDDGGGDGRGFTRLASHLTKDTLKSSPPENKVMKKASFLALFTTTVFFMLCSICGYAAFGNNAPGNFLTGFGVYEPFWLIDIANICIVIHLVGAYQVFNQPLFQFVENWSRKHWPDQIFLMAEHTITIPLWGNFTVSFFRVIWRTLYVILTTTVAMMFPFFNSFLGLLGAFGFWPLTVYFPIEMYISQAEIQRFSSVWIMLRLLSLACLLVSLAAACGSIQGIVSQLIGQSSLKFRGQTELQPMWREYL